MKSFNIYKKLYKLSGINIISWIIPVILNSFQSVISFVGIGLSTCIFVNNILDYDLENITKGLFIISFVSIYLIILLPVLNYFLENKVVEVKSGINISLFNKILNGKHNVFESYGLNNIMNLFQNDIDIASELFGWSLVTLLQAVLSGVVSIVILSILNVKLFIFSVLVLFLICLLNVKFNELISKYTKKVQSLSIIRFSFLKDLINNILIINLYGKYCSA